MANPDDKVTAPPAASALEDKSAQAAALVSTDDTAAPLPLPLSGAPTAGQDSERAPEKTAPAADLAAAKPEPAPIPASPVEQSSPSLLGSEPPDAAPAPSSAVVKNDKTDGDAVKPAPVVEAPALIAALAPSSSPPAEVAPAPAPTGDPVQLATTGDDQNKSSPASAPKPPPQSPTSGPPQPASTTGAIADADAKPNEARAPDGPKLVVKPQDAPKKDPVAQSNPAKSQPESTPIESVKSEPPKSEIAKVEPPAPVAPGPADNPKVTPVPPATPGVHLPGSDVAGSEVAGTAKPPVGSSAAGLETPAAAARNTPSQPSMPVSAAAAPAPPPESQVQIPDSQPQIPDSRSRVPDSQPQIRDSRSLVPESQPQISDTKKPDNRDAQTSLHAAELEPSRGPSVKQNEPDARPRTSRDLASAGWVSVPNSGKLAEDATNADAPRDGSGSGIGAESTATHDLRAHASKEVNFELESPRARASAEPKQNDRQSVLGTTAATEPSTRSVAGRVEPNAHVVEPLENFWTISRLYYSSGRYYRALWKANAGKYPEIDKLKVNDVIMVPAIEDLDPAYIDPPRARVPASLGTARNSGGRPRGSTRANADGLAESSTSSSGATGDERVSTARTDRNPGDSVPVRAIEADPTSLDTPPDAISTGQRS